MSTKREKSQARKRAEVILKVRSGLLSATEAAKQLGVSRKTYYEWEARGLEAMVEALENRPSGRPAIPRDIEKASLKEQVKYLEARLSVSEQTLEIREILEAFPGLKDVGRETEKPKKKHKKKDKKKRRGKS